MANLESVKGKEMMKRISFLLILLLSAVFATSANAAFVELADFNDTFTFTGTGIGIIADVHCVVYKDEDTHEYKYTYEITNNSDIDISFFAVELSERLAAMMAVDYFKTAGHFRMRTNYHRLV